MNNYFCYEWKESFWKDEDNNVEKDIDHDDIGLNVERCQKLYSKV